jgi:hypothetical protein
MAKKDPIRARLSDLQAFASNLKEADIEEAKRLTPELQAWKRESLNKAFKYFGLDPQDEFDQGWLPFLLAEALFGGPGRGGRTYGSRFWNLARLLGLGRHLAEFTASHPGASDVKAAAEIVKRPEYERFRYTPRAIRRQFPAARRVLLREEAAGRNEESMESILWRIRQIIDEDDGSRQSAN